jgi:hypothetical protein
MPPTKTVTRSISSREKTKRQKSSVAGFPQISQRRRRQPKQTHHRQAAQLSGHKTRSHAKRAALYKLISEQPSGNLARANAQSGATGAKVQVAWPRTTLSCGASSSTKPISSRKIFNPGRQLSHSSSSRIRRMAAGDVRLNFVEARAFAHTL